MRKMLLLLAAGGIVAAVVLLPKDGPAEPTEFDRKAAARTATLADWEKATTDERRRFARAYVEGRTGRENPRFEMEIAKYLDASVTHLRQRPLDDVESVLAEKLLHETADSGAEVLGWSR